MLRVAPLFRLAPWLIILLTWPLAGLDTPVRAVWPPVVALAVILATRHALVGLLVGGFCGVVILAGGDPWQAWLAIFADHLAPSLASTWKTGAIAFTLVLGGFAAVLDAGGGFHGLLLRLTRGDHDADRRCCTICLWYRSDQRICHYDQYRYSGFNDHSDLGDARHLRNA